MFCDRAPLIREKVITHMYVCQRDSEKSDQTIRFRLFLNQSCTLSCAFNKSCLDLIPEHCNEVFGPIINIYTMLKGFIVPYHYLQLYNSDYVCVCFVQNLLNNVLLIISASSRDVPRVCGT